AGEYFGGKVSAPIFRKIAERIIDLTGLHEYSQPDYMASNIVLASNPGLNEIIDPHDNLNLINFDISDAVKMLKDKDIPYEIEGAKKNALVIDQSSFTDE